MISWEKVRWVDGPDGPFVIRAQPANTPTTFAPAMGAGFLYLLTERLRLWLRRDQSWTVEVRRAENGLYGPLVTEELFGSRKQAIEAVGRIEAHLTTRKPSTNS